MNFSSANPAIATLFIDQLKSEGNLHAVMLDLLKLPAMQGARLYSCGGMIRDAAIAVILGKASPSVDFDFVCEGLGVDQLQLALDLLAAKNHLVENVVHAGKSFPVWKVKVHGMDHLVDMALTRTETSFGAHHRDFHVNAEAVSVQEDAVRRDFTINAMYVQLYLDAAGHIAGELLDFNGGLADIQNRVIHCVGRPADRFNEDPLRMLRAVRFAARFPGFSISEETAGAIRDLAPELIATVSKERFRTELFGMLSADPQQALGDLDRLGLLGELMPQLAPLNDVRLARICAAIGKLAAQCPNGLDPQHLFTALLFDLAVEELAEKMTASMTSARMPAIFFSTTALSTVARQIRLAGIRDMARLCNDTLVLLHFDFLENPDAVMEALFSRYEDPADLLRFYRVHRQILGLKGQDLERRLAHLPQTRIDLNHLLATSGIPRGPYLQHLKLCLRQAEIDGAIATEPDARGLLNKIYLEEVHLLQEHADKVRRWRSSAPDGQLPAPLREEIRWLLFTKPVLLVKTYRDNKLMDTVFPELAEAEKNVRMTVHHFSDAFINDALLALSILYEEVPSPSAVQILSLLFLDIGMTATRGTGKDGQPTYYNHERVGADLAVGLCKRLGIDQEIAGDVCFIIRNHNALVMSGGPNRFRKLIGTVGDSLLDDLLLVHRVDQLAKMQVRNGKRIENGKLDHYNHIVNQRDKWAQEAERRAQQRRGPLPKPLVSGAALKQNNPLWGPGLTEGPALGKIKHSLERLRAMGLIETRQQALQAARNHIVLHHLFTQPDIYLEALREQGLLDAIFPELSALVDLAQTGPYHQEDAYTHTLQVIRGLPANASKALRLAAVFHDIGKSRTRSFDETKGVYHFFGHEKNSLELLEQINDRFGWTDTCFNQNKVNWLIANHIRIQTDWTTLEKPLKTIEKRFIRDSRTGKELPASWVDDLVRLRKADSSGTVVVDPAIRRRNERNLVRFIELLTEAKSEYAHKKKLTQDDERVRTFWNGRLVLENFQVSGPEVGRLVQCGQDYVRTVLKSGRLPRLGEIIRHLEQLTR